MHLQCLHCIIIVQGNYTHFALVPVFEMESANVCLKFILERWLSATQSSYQTHTPESRPYQLFFIHCKNDRLPLEAKCLILIRIRHLVSLRDFPPNHRPGKRAYNHLACDFFHRSASKQKLFWLRQPQAMQETLIRLL